TDLVRSHLLHRLRLLGVAWGEPREVRGKSGTFHELWELRWRPELAVDLIQAGVWGTTVAGAAAARARHEADQATGLAAITRLVDAVVLADLPDAVGHLMDRLQAVAAVASDVADLMAAVPPLANVLRYGSVRRSDTGTVGRVVDGLVARVCVGLPGACTSLDDEAAERMHGWVVELDRAIGLLDVVDGERRRQAGGGSAADAGASGPGLAAAAEVAAQSSPLPVGRQRAAGPRQAAGELLGEQLPGRTEGQGEGASSAGLLASWRATLA